MQTVLVNFCRLQTFVQHPDGVGEASFRVAQVESRGVQLQHQLPHRQPVSSAHEKCTPAKEKVQVRLFYFFFFYNAPLFLYFNISCRRHPWLRIVIRPNQPLMSFSTSSIITHFSIFFSIFN